MDTLRNLDKDVENLVTFKFIIAVPAPWSIVAKKRMSDAFVKAATLQELNRLPEVDIVSEPEATAIYTLSRCPGHGLNIGDSIVVVDAGGCTVDLVSYTIRRFTPVWELDQATTPSGGCCGSVFIDLRFKKFLIAKLGKLPGFGGKALLSAMETFDLVRHKGGKLNQAR